jgi:hypothetical protein
MSLTWYRIYKDEIRNWQVSLLSIDDISLTSRVQVCTKDSTKTKDAM